ncbi:V4R domain-containing protein [Methanocaldococcus sp. 28A]
MHDYLKSNMEVKMFEIDDIIKTKRTHLGDDVSVWLFRVLRLIALDEIISMGSCGIVYHAGKKIGKTLKLETLDDFLDWIEKHKIGIPEVNGNVVKIYECVTCSGIPKIGKPVCHFEGGLIAGFLEKLWNKKVLAKEVKCWGLGDEVCEFKIIEI